MRVCQSESAGEGRDKKLCSELQFGNTCTSKGKDDLRLIVRKYNDVFALTDDELGETSVVAHSIDTGTAPPVKSTARRLPYALRRELQEEMDNLLQSGCIEPSTSPHSSPLVLVRKKSGELRACVDYRALNRDTVPDRYPLLRIDELMNIVGRRHAKVFSSLDLMKGYHQVKMEDSLKPKTAFICHLGLYQYRRIPFGLTNVPATFQRLMGKLFSGRKWDFVFAYLDETLIASQTVEEHLDHLQKVFQQLQESGLCLQPSKCMFATKEIEYLGHTLTPEGVKLNGKNVQAITEFPEPKSTKEVQSFVGLTNFYCCHIPNVAAISRPLTDHTRYEKSTGKPVPFVWMEGCQRAFEEVKKCLISAPVLHPPDWEEFFMWTDASLVGLEQFWNKVHRMESEHQSPMPAVQQLQQSRSTV